MKVCATCSVEMKPAKVGVTVIEYAKAVGPYRIWMADMWQCTKCGWKAILNFAHKPSAEHFQEAFQAALERTKELDQQYVFHVPEN